MASHAVGTFTSIFPASTTSHTVPTPQATPDIGFAPPGEAFGGPTLTSILSSPRTNKPRQSIRNARQAQSQQQQQNSAAQRQVKRNLAWSTATQFLSLQEAKEPLRRHVEDRRSREVDEALCLLLIGEDGEPADGCKELFDWYIEEVKQHFSKVVQIDLYQVLHEETPQIQERAWAWLNELTSQLVNTKRIYTAPIQHHLLPLLRQLNANVAKDFQHNANSSISTIITSAALLESYHVALEEAIFETGRAMLPLASARLAPDPATLMATLSRLTQALAALGSSTDFVERSLASAVDRLTNELIYSDHLKVDWYDQRSVVPKLKSCMIQSLVPFVKQILAKDGEPVPSLDSNAKSTITVGEQQQWIEMAVARLARSRLHNLFDYVIRWDISKGAIKDIKEYITMPGARAEIVQSFQQQLQRRLLHAGATTVQILDAYIHTIRAFTELDPKGVLLDRVAWPIRRYLKDRDDTTRVIIASLLADVTDEPVRADQNADISLQIAKQMQDAVTGTSQEYDVDLDWNNMNWNPDPHDAGPEYRRSSTEDIVSSLLSLYDREDFINELRNILGDHLLKTQNPELEKEIRLLEMFKTKLGEDKLQAAEVMLHDMEDSRHINATVQADAKYKVAHLRSTDDMEETENTDLVGHGEVTNELIDLSAQILSAFFWPPLRDDAFKIPNPVALQQQGFETGFRSLKDMRRLKWLHELGSATVELEFSDRTIDMECATFQASVIYAFHDTTQDVGMHAAQPHHTPENLVEHLDMDESLVRQALAFWVSKLVLTETSPGSDTYTVLESLPTSSDAAKEAEAAAAMAAEAAQVAAIKSPEDILMENMQIYRQFILGMLTNQGRMEANRMHMMLKMVVPGGFAFSLDELRTLLQRMGVEGLLAAEGEAWSVIK